MAVANTTTTIGSDNASLRHGAWVEARTDWEGVGPSSNPSSLQPF